MRALALRVEEFSVRLVPFLRHPLLRDLDNSHILSKTQFFIRTAGGVELAFLSLLDCIKG